MKIILASFVFASVMAGTALAQTSATSQTSAAASDNSSVSASKSGTHVNSSSSTNAAVNATIHKSGSQASSASQLQSATDVRTKDGDKSLTSSGNVTGTASSTRALMGSADATSDTTLNHARSASGASIRSAASSGAHLNKVGGSTSLSHESQGAFGIQGTSLDSSTAGSGILSTRGANAHLTGATRTGIRTK